MALDRTVALKLEIERVSLLYRQNILGVIALLLYGFSYAAVCGEIMGTTLLTIWLAFVSVSGVCRLAGSWLWLKKREHIKDLSEINRWHLFIQSMLFISGAAWGVAGWMIHYATQPEQQIFISLTVIFMGAGSLVCWWASPRAMFLVVIPAVLPWIAGQLLSYDSDFVFTGALSFIYLLMGIKGGLALSRYVDDSFKLNIENGQLNLVLQKEIMVKDQAEAALQLSLSSSNAMGWNWDVSQNIFNCSGDLNRTLGLQMSHFSGTLEEFLQHFHSGEDRTKFYNLLQSVAANGGDLVTDLRMKLADGTMRDLTFRGKAQQEHVTGIAWDATIQKSQDKIVQELKVREAANTAKSIFLANASHEIRTPVAVISGFVEALLQHAGDHPDPQEQKDLLAIERNCKYLTALVNDFLDLAKIENGKFYIQKSPMSLQKEIDESILMIQSKLDAKKLKLNLIYDPTLPVLIESDAIRFRQIIVNLLSNSIKFTESGEVRLQASHKVGANGEGILTLRISDSGIGMDAGTQAHLFEPFIRGSDKAVQRVSGAGLGLSLSKNLAQLLGGDVRLVHSAPGMGSEFEFTLTTGRASEFQPFKKSQQKEGTDQLLGSRILVVDDDEDLRELMQRYLERQGASVEIASNGQEAVDEVFAKPFDLVIMDMKMAVMDGYQATKILRRRGFQKPIIAVTAHANTDDKQRSLDAGCDHYLSKPVDFSFMTRTIRFYLDNSDTGRPPVSELR